MSLTRVIISLIFHKNGKSWIKFIILKFLGNQPINEYQGSHWIHLEIIPWSLCDNVDISKNQFDLSLEFGILPAKYWQVSYQLDFELSHWFRFKLDLGLNWKIFYIWWQIKCKLRQWLSNYNSTLIQDSNSIASTSGSWVISFFSRAHLI